jgi:hypothetical protein
MLLCKLVTACMMLWCAGREDRKHLKIMHHLHRTSYMSERMHYYERRHKAEAEPHKYMSFIMDGMQQQHCLLPWYGHVGQFVEHLPQHIQGDFCLFAVLVVWHAWQLICLLLLVDASRCDGSRAVH